MNFKIIKNNNSPIKNNNIPLTDFNKISNILKNYLNTHESIIYDILKGLINCNIINIETYEFYKNKWNKIKKYAHEQVNPINTYYQEFTYELYNAIEGNMNWYYEIGRFPLPRNNFASIKLSCSGDLNTKIITINTNELAEHKIYVYGHNTKCNTIIEDNTTFNFNNIKKIIKICDILYLLNNCKKCNNITFNNNYNNICDSCLNISAKIIQDKWRNAIANPKFLICQKRLSNEFNNLF
jgi:hypothetical protein